MTVERIAEILKASGAYGWEISDTKLTGREFYFIKHSLDQARAKDVRHITLKVYGLSEDGSSMGSASADVPPSASEEELAKTVSDLIYQASLVKNKPYELNPARPVEPMPECAADPDGEARRFIEAMASVRETESEDLNSYEIFANFAERRFVNSRGVDVTERFPSSMVEAVVNARRDGHEIELYRLYELGACDAETLRRDIEETMAFGKDRLIAVPTPPLGSCAAVFSTDAALQIYEYFIGNLDAAYVVRGMSAFEIGKPVAQDIEGDRVSVFARRVLPGSPANFSCDAEGAPVRDLCLMEDSVPRHWCGSRMFTQYLGLDDAFSLTNWEVKGGSRPAAELRKGDFLEVVEFSDFQVDDMTGDIFGEIRLGYLHRQGNVIPVTGGSVSGNMRDNLACMSMSSEQRQYANALIPAVTRLEKVTVSGIEE
ncbi:MAG: TldD/PmbA family protein [Firmicutes bacterium]|nr:TldD/PmbA family protein [Bacillota bacterium]MBQ4371968.1 TldD/PmbA family protein [Bacillota bacterium]